jgi:PAS domain S-box-containing protein
VNLHSDGKAQTELVTASSTSDPLLSCFIDDQSRVLAVSPMFAAMLGTYEPAALQGRTLLDFVHPSSVAVVDAESMFGVVAEASTLTEVRLVRSDGEQLLMRCVIEPVMLEQGAARRLVFDAI